MNAAMHNLATKVARLFTLFHFVESFLYIIYKGARLFLNENAREDNWRMMFFSFQ